MIHTRFSLAITLSIVLCAANAAADDYFLTIGGGYSPSGNQASLERNVLFYQRVLGEQNLGQKSHDIYFADGQHSRRDLQVIDKQAIPKANRLMAEFFASSRDLGLTYRNHEVPDVRGATSQKNIRDWFQSVGSNLTDTDRLIIYVTAHGSASGTRDQPYNTSISLWNNDKVTVRQLVEMMDTLPDNVAVVVIMVQCHAGGFARMVYRDGHVGQGFSTRNRCGFFATVHDRAAAGCTPEIDEASYVEYSTFFWEAIAGHTRMGDPIDPPDYNGDGQVSFDEAHAYTILKSDTIDLPIKTSGEFLGVESGFRDADHPELLPRDLAYDEILKLSTDSERAILAGLSEQLQLSGNDRLVNADRQARQTRGRGRGQTRQRAQDPGDQLRRTIANDLRRRWPELSNVLNPVAIALVTSRSDEFIKAVEGHKDYQRYREQVEAVSNDLTPQEKKVKYERFVRTAENIILRENLQRLGNEDAIARYESIVASEAGSLAKRVDF